MNQHPATWAWAQDLKGHVKLILLALADHSGESWGAAFPSMESLAKKAGISRATVIRCIKELTKAKYIIKEKRPNTSNKYHLNRERDSDIETNTELKTPTQKPLSSSNVKCQPDTKEYQSDAPVASKRYSDGITETPKPISNQSVTNQLTKEVEWEVEETKAKKVELPEALNTSAFKAAWSSYLQYLRESKKPPPAPSSVKENWAEMAKWGHDKAIEAIRQTIRNGWKGIFEPKASPSKPRAEGAPQPDKSSAKPLSTWEITKKIEAIGNRQKELLKRRAEVAGGDYVWDSPQIKAEYYELVDKKKQLNRELINL